MELRENIERVFDGIADACRRSGRKREEVTLVAVSKKFPAATVARAAALGLRDFGESYAQELRDKSRELEDAGGEPVRWHFVGGLQRNKVKYVVGKAVLVHSVDGIPLAAELDRRAGAAGTRVRALVEINCGERAKGGIRGEDLGGFLEAASRFGNVSFEGLMAVPPPRDEERWFSRLRELRDGLRGDFPGLRELSMGMSGDFAAAIEEGATIVRVGSAVFGPRPG